MARPGPAAATHASPAPAGMVSYSGRHRLHLLISTKIADSARVTGAAASWITKNAAVAPAAKFPCGAPARVLGRFARDENGSALPVGYGGTVAQDSPFARGMPTHVNNRRAQRSRQALRRVRRAARSWLR